MLPCRDDVDSVVVDWDSMLQKPSSAKRKLRLLSRRGRGIRRPILLGLGLFGLILLMMVGTTAYLLTERTLELEALRVRFERALQARVPDTVSITMDRASIAYRWGEGIIVEANNVDISIKDQAEIVIGAVRTNTNLGDVIAGRFDPDILAADNLTITLADAGALASKSDGNADGNSDSGQGAETNGLAETAGRADLARAMIQSLAKAIIRADEGLRAAKIDEVRLNNIALQLPKNAHSILERSLVRRLPETIWRPLGPGRSKIWSSVDEPGNNATLKIEWDRNEDGSDKLIIALDQVPSWAFFPLFADATGPVQYDAIGSLLAFVTLDQNGKFSRLQTRLTMGPGPIIFNRFKKSAIDGIDIFAELGPYGDRIRVHRGLLFSGLQQYFVHGEIGLGSRQGPLSATMRIVDGAFPALPDDPSPERITGGFATATLDPASWTIAITRCEIVGTSGSVSILGNLQFAGENPGIALVVQTAGVSLAMARGLWPPFLAYQVRTWFDDNMKSGRAGPGTVEVALPLSELKIPDRKHPLPVEAINGSIEFQDARFTPLDVFPEIRDGAGSLEFVNASAVVGLSSGHIDFGDIGRADLTGSQITIPGLAAPDPQGSLLIEASGPVSALAEMSDAGPLSVSRDHGIFSDAVSGNGQASVAVDVPLTGGTRIASLSPQFRIGLKGFGSKKPIDGRTITNADIVLTGSPLAYTIEGTAVIDGIEAAIDIDSGSAATGDAVKLSLDDDARRQLGMDLGDMLIGPTVATLFDTDDPDRQRVKLDLTDARINLPFVAWEKGAGVSAHAEFEFKQTGGGTEITNLVVAGQGFRAAGSVVVSKNGDLESLNLDDVALRPGDRFAVDLAANGDELDIKVSGARFDGRGLIGKLKTDTSAARWEIPTVNLSLDLQRIKGYSATDLFDVQGTVYLSNGLIRGLTVAASTGPEQPVKWTITENGNRRGLGLLAANGGAVLRFVDVYEKIVGGELEINEEGPVTADSSSGTMELRNFRVINERALARALDVDAASDARTARDAIHQNIDTTNIVFSLARLPFSRSGDVITLQEAFVRGPAIGATGSGTVNLEERQFALSGTLVPAFGINNVAGAIPLFGEILGGGRNEGLVGVTYRIFGPFGAPVLQINPISAITPGIFRKIFEYR